MIIFFNTNMRPPTYLTPSNSGLNGLSQVPITVKSLLLEASMKNYCCRPFPYFAKMRAPGLVLPGRT